MDTSTAAPASSSEHARLTSRMAALALGVAVSLIALKAWAWAVSGSVAMLASLADSGLDFAASVITFFAVRYAAHPPDRDHRFGHGKAEAFAGLLQGGLVALSAAIVAFEAASHLFAPVTLSHGVESIAVMAVSIVLTSALVFAQTRAVRRTGSVATRADRLHYAGDLAANLVVILGIAAGAFFSIGWADPVAGLIVAAGLLWGAIKVAREAADHLLDREIPAEQRARIRALAEQDGRILRVHDLRTRTSGPYTHIQFHAELDPNLTLKAAHKIVVAAEDRIRAEFPTADLIIHPDPKGAAAPHGHEDFERASGG